MKKVNIINQREMRTIDKVEKLEKEKKESKIPTFLKEQYKVIALVITILQVLAIFQPLNFYYSLFLFVINVIAFLFIKDFLEEKDKKFGFFIFKASFLLLVMNISSIFGQKLDIMPNKKANLSPLIMMLGAIISVATISLFTKDDKKDFLNNIYDTSILSKMGLKVDNDTTPTIGDATICINKDTNKKVILPFKDRFLHMLVLGPTGCGKTSQILIPMINEDISSGNGVTVIEPKGDLAEKVYAMAKYYGKEAVYFNPTHPDCPIFNPLYGEEDEVIENMATTFKMLSPGSSAYFLDMNEVAIRNALKVLKRLKGNDATLVDLSVVLHNSNSQGKILLNSFSRLPEKTVEITKENAEIASWFNNEYYNEKSKVYEHCSGLRSQLNKITSNTHLRRVLIEEKKILAISTAQGELGALGAFLGYFIILNFQSAVFKRPGNENTRIPHFLYIDEFQTYSNPGFANMLTQGRSYKVASHLATQNRALMAMGGGQDGKNFVELVSTNARNVVVFPGINSADAKYYSEEFGEITRKETTKSTTRQQFNPLYGFKPLSSPSIGERVNEITEARFSPSDLIFKDFGEITYRLVRHNSVATPGNGLIEYIDKDFNDELDNMVDEYNKLQTSKNLLLNNVNDDESEQTLIVPDASDNLRPVADMREVLDKDVEYDEDEYIDDIFEISDDIYEDDEL